MNTQHIAALTALTATLLLVGCSDTADHALVTPVAATIADQPDAGGEKITHFGDKTELFVEFPTLIVGQAVSFVAHLTQLSDFKPHTQGKLLS